MNNVLNIQSSSTDTHGQKVPYNICINYLLQHYKNEEISKREVLPL